MTREEADMLQVVDSSLRGVLVQGLRQANHSENDWIDAPVEQHAMTAIGHIALAERMRQGNKPVDAEGVEGHLQRALCRIAMALYLERQNARLP